MKRRPRKIITRVIVFLLLGAIVNVAVAWGIAYSISVDDVKDSTSARILDPPRVIFNCRTVGTRLIMVVAADARELSFMGGPVISPNEEVAWSRTSTLTGQIPNRNGFPAVVDIARGWPIPCLAAGIDGRFNGEYLEKFTYVNCMYLGRPARSSEFGHRVLPLRPIWPGFAINTIFYAATLWLVFFAPGSVRRTLRRRRGLCPACAYPIGTSPVCTECGKPVI